MENALQYCVFANSIYDEETFRRLLHQGDKLCVDVFQKYGKNARFMSTLQHMVRLNRFSRPDLPFEARVRNEDYIDSEIMQCVDAFETLAKLNGLQWKTVFDIMTDKLGKVNTVYLVGPPSVGKSSIVLLLSSLYEDYEIGRFAVQNCTTQFWLQDLYQKNLYIGEEVKANAINIQTFLLLLEGNPNLYTEIKYKENVQLARKPVLISTNYDIWSNCCAYASACMERIYRVELKHKTDKTLRYGRDVLKCACAYLYNKYVK